MDHLFESDLITNKHHDSSPTTGFRKSLLETPLFATVWAAAAPAGAELLPVDVKIIEVHGHTIEGIGAAQYRRVGDEPLHVGKFQDASSQWWELHEFNVTPEMFGAVADGITDDTIPTQSAFVYAGEKKVSVHLLSLYRITAPIAPGYHGLRVNGHPTSEIIFEGASDEYAVDPPRVGKIYPVSWLWDSVTIRVLSGAGAFRANVSYSHFRRCGYGLNADALTAVLMEGDGPHGSGCYYNFWTDCRIEAAGRTNCIGWNMVPEDGPIGTTRACNANSWTGGRISGCELGVNVVGNGNTVSTIFENCSTCFKIDHPYSVAPTYLTAGNRLTATYVEHCRDVFTIGLGAAGNHCDADFVTSITGQVFQDATGLNDLNWVGESRHNISTTRTHKIISNSAAASPKVEGSFPGWELIDPNNASSLLLRNASGASTGLRAFEAVFNGTPVLQAGVAGELSTAAFKLRIFSENLEYSTNDGKTWVTLATISP